MSDQFERISAAFSESLELIRELGTGGMGTVYLARDLRYDRPVALKVIRKELSDATTSARFEREVKIAGKLTHPKIPPLFDSGERDGFQYFVMAFVDGKPLSELLAESAQLPVEKALRIAIDVCDALQYAHDQGLVHRDIKPENVMISGETALVMDFGIARDQSASDLTQAGLSIGTPWYMSPEQVDGRGITSRSDLYSLGCVLYQTLTGTPPFSGASAQTVLVRHLTEQAPGICTVRPTVPASVEAAIFKAMAKSPADRYQKASDFRADLERGLVEAQNRSTGPIPTPTRTLGRRRLIQIAAATLAGLGIFFAWRASLIVQRGSPGPASVAVLALRDVSPDGTGEYLGDGIAEEIIYALSSVQEMKVAARTSAFAFKTRSAMISEIGEELGVRSVLEGTLLRTGDSLRIDTRLFDAASEEELWHGSFVTSLPELGNAQAEIAASVMEALGLARPTGSLGRLTVQNTQSPAYDMYLRARFSLNQRGIAMGTALEEFRQAIAIDPGYAPAHAGLADALTLLGLYGFMPPGQALPAALASAETALELDSLNADAYASRGFIGVVWGWDWVQAGRDFERSIALNPGNPTARHWYAIYLLLTQPSADGALAQTQIAIEVDPLAAAPRVARAQALLAAGRGSTAIDELRLAASNDPASAMYANAYLTLALGEARRWEEALELSRQMVDVTGRNPIALSSLGVMYARSGQTEDAEAILDELTARGRREHVQALTMAHLLASLGRVDESFEQLQLAFDNKESLFISMKVMPEFRPLAGDPRFTAILEKGGLENFATAAN